MASIEEVYLGYGVVHNDKSCEICAAVDAEPVKASLSIRLSMIALFVVGGLLGAYIASWFVLYHTNFIK